MPHAVSLIFGTSKAAEQIARILCSAGSKVTVIGSSGEFAESLRQQMKADIQTDIPFTFPDDLRNQQDLFESRLSRLHFTEDASAVDDVELIVDAGHSAQAMSARSRFPEAACASLGSPCDAGFVHLKLFEPLEANKIVEIKGAPTPALAKLRRILQRAGLTEISENEAREASQLIADWRKNAQPIACLEDEVSTLISGHHQTDETKKRHTVMH